MRAYPLGAGWNDDVETYASVWKEIIVGVSYVYHFNGHCTHLSQVVCSHGLRASSNAILKKLKCFKCSFRQLFHLLFQLRNAEG